MGRTVTIGAARLRLLLAPLVAAVSMSCGGANQSLTGPSAVAGTTAVLSGDSADAATAADSGEFRAVGRGRGNGGGKDNGRGKDNGGGKDKDKDRDRRHDEPDDDNRGPGGDDRAPGRRDDARVVGFVSATTGNTLTVDGVSIAAGPGAEIRHGNRILTLADIEVGDHVQARGVMEGGVLVAIEIKVQDTGRDNDDVDDVEIEGLISGLSATSGCPVVTFMIGATTVRTSAMTIFDDVTCATLANTARVEINGIRQADGSILATKVDAEGGPDEVEGRVFEFSGAASCPTATFRVGPTLSLSTRVTTMATTTFSGVACADLTNGARVEVEGTKQADGSIIAALVKLD